MAKIGIIRCEKNEHKCPLTSCLRGLHQGEQAFAPYQGENELVGVFTCRCPGDQAVNLGKILKSKGAEVIHWCTCLFAHKDGSAWSIGGGLCEDPHSLVRRVAEEAGVPCVTGTAHLPSGYAPRVVGGPLPTGGR